jgi:hypothetical protein
LVLAGCWAACWVVTTSEKGAPAGKVSSPADAIPAMKLFLDSFWRAAAYLFMPRVLVLSLLPLLLIGGGGLALAYFYWGPAVGAVRGLLESWFLTEALLHWLDAHAGASFRAVMAPAVVVLLTVPVVVLLSLLVVAVSMTPMMVGMVSRRRFPGLEHKRGGSFFQGFFWALVCTIAALVALVLTAPMWLIPPLGLLIPPLIWGWLATKVMSFDALAEHASREERRALLDEHRWPLLLIGVLSGYVGAAPSLVWAFGAFVLIMAPFVIAVSVWLYTMAFAFSSLWFVHYCLAALQRMRALEADKIAQADAAAQSQVVDTEAKEVPPAAEETPMVVSAAFPPALPPQ